MKPPKSCLDSSFRYVPAARTSVKNTFARVRAEQKRNAMEREQKVAPLQRKVGS